MRITSPLFDAFLKCATKGHLRSLGEISSGNEYAEWVRGRDESYQREAARGLQETVPETQRAVAPPATENLKAAKWTLAVDLMAQTPDRSADNQVCESRPNEESRGLGGPPSEQLLESRLHAVERVPSEGRGKPAQFVPIRFVFRNKLTKDDRLLLAFDALVVSQVLGREVSLGKVIHGDDHATLKVRASALAGEVRKRLGKIAALLSNTVPPDLVLNRHCAECEFQARCRKIAVEKDDLSLLAGMSAKERQKLRSKGIFTVTQLSYTFRPRRRPKQMRDKREKYHHSLKALAIREKKIHIVGSPELKIEGTPVYLDVEGLPDRDFYYLIGVRIGNGEAAVQHSLWADTVEDEGKIWRGFLGVLETVEKPVLIHYGSYETTFLNRMCGRYDGPANDSKPSPALAKPVNLSSSIFAQIYYPTFSNGLKDIAGFLGFEWSEREPSGIKTLLWRHLWETTRSTDLRDMLCVYNTEDCHALEIVSGSLALPTESTGKNASASNQASQTVSVEAIKRYEKRFGNFSSPITQFEQINKAAHWDYQRNRIYVRSSKLLKRNARRSHVHRRNRTNTAKRVPYKECPTCPFCGGKGTPREFCSRVLHDLHFGRSGIKRWTVDYRFFSYSCACCHKSFGTPEDFWPQSKYGRNLVAFLVYLSVEVCIPLVTVGKILNRFFGLDVPQGTLFALKNSAAKQYKHTYDGILLRLAAGSLLHVDETQISIRGKTAYVWVFTNLHEVAYVYADSREGALVQGLLKDYKGILVSDFYGVYDSLTCPQQKCLVHLMRDLNDEVLDHPYDEELKQIVASFAVLLRAIVETVDRRGLKRHFLGKHRAEVGRFYRRLGSLDCRSAAAEKCRQRFQKNRDKLFTFLSYDGVPWNNNNAEHAIKAFAKLRDVVRGSCTEDTARDYLVLLSVCQTCKYMGVDFLDFLRSGEKDIHAFAESRRGHRRRTQTSQADGLPAEAIPDSGG
jgi:predicted RecB family nuclease